MRRPGQATGSPRVRTAVGHAVLWGGLLAMTGAPILSQTAPAPVAPTMSAFGLEGFADAAVRSHNDGTMVALSVRFPTGSADDPVGAEGTAWLLARTLIAQADELLDPADAVLTVEVDRGHTTFSLLAVPNAWHSAWDRVADLLFRGQIQPDALERQRARLQGRLVFEAGSPAMDFRREAASVLGDPGSEWARPVRGTLASVDSLDIEGLSAWKGRHLRRDQAVAALVGPVPDGPVRPNDIPRGTVAQAWYLGDRTLLDREVTSTWITVAYPVPAGTSQTAVEMVAHLIDEELDPVPPSPDRFNVDVRLEQVPRGVVLVVDVSVLPEAADRWEERIQDVVSGLAEEPIPNDFFQWRRRRFRTSLLLGESRPEVEAARTAADLARGVGPRDLLKDIWELNAHTVQETAGALGEPRVLRLGPDLVPR